VIRFIFGFLISVLLQLSLCSIVIAKDLDDKHARISTWGKIIKGSLKEQSIDSLKIDAITNKSEPVRVIRIQQFHMNSIEVLNILKSAAAILEEGNFEINDQQNLAKTSVSFEFELTEVCKGTAGRFEIRSTGNSMFDIGCTYINDEAVTQYEFLRIRSKKLYEALRPHFPREILD